MNSPKTKMKNKTLDSSKSQPSFRQLVPQVFKLALPYSKLKLSAIFLLLLLKGIFEVVGVASIFPFLALAAAPNRINDSTFGRIFLSWLPEMSTSGLLTAAGILAISMLLFSNLTNIATEFLVNRYAFGFGHWLRLRLLNKILDHPFEYFVENNSGVPFKRIHNDVSGYVNNVLLPLLDSCSRAITSVLLLTTLLLIHLQIALTAAVVICGAYLLIFLALKGKRKVISDELKSSWKNYVIELQQLFDGIKPIKVHDVEDHFVERFSKPSKKISKHEAWLPVFTHVPRYLIEPLAFSGLIGVVIILNLQQRDLTTILPNLGVMALAGYRLLPSLQLLYGQITKVSSSRYMLEEVYEEFENASDLPPRQTPANPKPIQWNDTVSIDHVSFSYSDGTQVLDDVTLKLPKNSSTAIVGKTGTGKSTLADLLLGLQKPDSGRICIDGVPVGDNNIHSWRAAIGYVPQEVFLVDGTITANIALGIPSEEVDMDRVMFAVGVAQIRSFIEDELPEGYDSFVGERGQRLSGGQRQRIGLARAIYRQPSILIFDEATSALDNITESELMDAIEKMSSDMTIVMIAHRLSTVKNCDQIFVIENGKMLPTCYQEIQQAV